MNQKKAKLLRKWAKKKGYDFDATKKLYLSKNRHERKVLSEEMTAYLKNDRPKST